MKVTANVHAAIVEVEVPIRIESEANLGSHRMIRYKRAKRQREAVHYTLLNFRGLLKIIAAGEMVCVTLTRLGPWRRPLDDDNLRSGFKAVRDQVAAALGIDDGNTKRIRFEYDQQRAATYGARVRIERTA